MGVDHDAVTGCEQLAVHDLLLQLGFLGSFELIRRLLGQLVGEGFLDLAAQHLDGSALGVVVQDCQLAVRLLKREPLAAQRLVDGVEAVFQLQLGQDVRGFRGPPFASDHVVQLLTSPPGALEPGCCFFQIQLSRLDCALDRLHVRGIDALFVFQHCDLGDFTDEPCLLKGGFSRLGRDLLVRQLVCERRRIELANQVPLLYLGSLGKNRNNHRRAFDPGQDIGAHGRNPACRARQRRSCASRFSPRRSAFRRQDWRLRPCPQPGRGPRPPWYPCPPAVRCLRPSPRQREAATRLSTIGSWTWQ